MDEIESVRLRARAIQISQVSYLLSRPPVEVGSYAGRDTRSGLRRYETVDGGVFLTAYQSNSVPEDQNRFLSGSSSIERIGFADQKPAL